MPPAPPPPLPPAPRADALAAARAELRVRHAEVIDFDALMAASPTWEQIVSLTLREIVRHRTTAAPTGSGKTHEAIRTAATFASLARAAGRPHRVVFAVPHHRLSAELAKRIADDPAVRAAGLSVAIWRGRSAEAPPELRPRPPRRRKKPYAKTMCLDLEPVADGLALGARIEREVCGPDEEGRKCRFRDICAYYRQVEVAAHADILIVAHELLYAGLPKAVGDGFGLTLIDESYENTALDLDRHPFGLGTLVQSIAKSPVLRKDEIGRVEKDDDATKEYIKLAQQLEKALLEGGHLSSEALDAAGLSASLCQSALALHWRRKRERLLYPGMPKFEREAVKDGAYGKGNMALFRWAAVWEEAAAILEDGRAETSHVRHHAGRLYLFLRREICGDVRNGPVIALNATPAPRVITDAIWRGRGRNGPYGRNASAMETVRIPATPHPGFELVLARGHFGKEAQSLPGKDDPDRATRLRHLDVQRDFVRLRAREVSGATLVVAYKALTESPLFRDIPNVSLLHLGALAGLDSYRDFAQVIVIGRLLAPQVQTHYAALAFFDEPVPYQQSRPIRRDIALSDGSTAPMDITGFADPRLNAIKRMTTDDGVVQAIGRVNIYDHPVRAWVLADVEMPWPATRIVDWSEIAPGTIERMALRGAVLFSPGDAYHCFPGFFASEEDARQVFHRAGISVTSYKVNILNGVSRKSGWHEATYRPAGRGQQIRRALFDLAAIADPEAWLTERLGPLARFEIDAAEGDVPAEEGGSG